MRSPLVIFLKKTLLSCSGSEAVENAVKVARAYTGRQAIITFEGAYHGRTLLTLGMTSKYALFKKRLWPFSRRNLSLAGSQSLSQTVINE